MTDGPILSDGTTVSDPRSGAPRFAAADEEIATTARECPGAVALEWNGHRLTYRELDERAALLANRLRRHGVGPKTPVATSVPPGPGLLIALLGVLRSGGTHVPLPPSCPAERLGPMPHDSGMEPLLTGPLVLRVDPATGHMIDEPDAGANVAVHHPANAAVVIRASGTTSKAVTHRSVSEPMETLSVRPGTGPEPRTPTERRVARFVDRAADDAVASRVTAGARTAPPASPGQVRLWFAERLRPGAPEQVVSIPLRLRGPLDVDALAHALRGLTTRHEVLRTRYAAAGGELVQLIDPPQPLRLRREDLRGLSSDERERRLAGFVALAAGRPFRLGEEMPFRAHLAELGADDHVLVVVIHRIACDDRSVHVIARELRELYRAEIAGGCPALDPLPSRFADHAVRQRTWLAGDDAAAQLAYWAEHLDGLAPLELPTDRPRPAQPDAPGNAKSDATDDVADGAVGGFVGFDVPAVLAQDVLGHGRGEGASAFVTMLGVFFLLLARRTGRDDLAVGTTVARRTGPGMEDLVGFFANTVVLRVDLAGCVGFGDVLGRTRDVVAGAFANQELPVERVVAGLGPGLSTAPMFRVRFEMEGSAGPSFVLPGIEAEPITLGPRPDGRGLTFRLVELGDGSYSGRIAYDPALFDRRTVAGMAGEFVGLVERVAAHPAATGRTRESADAGGVPVVDHLVTREACTVPGTDTEGIIAAIWADVLEVGRVGARDDFFQLGGHSVLAAQVRLRVQDELDIDLPLRALFDATTLTEFAAVVEQAVQGEVARLSDAEVDAMLSEEGT